VPPGAFVRQDIVPPSIAALRYPHERVLLPRTRLAYVHLHNLLTDAKRDRAARVFGYVAIWLPEELVLLYLQEGELVNATVHDGRRREAVPIAEALTKVPSAPEYGEITFCEADDEQLACMYFTQVAAAEPWPAELEPTDPKLLFPYLMSTTYDGVVEITVDGHVNYLILRNGSVERAFLSVGGKEPLVDRVQQLFARDGRPGRPSVHRWPVPPPIPVQAPHALIQAYRELTKGLVKRLLEAGKESASDIAEHAREGLVAKHPALQEFALVGVQRDPVADVQSLTAAIVAWVTEIVWAGVDLETHSPEAILRDLTWERRHMLQSAGFFDRLPWKLT
jgi:hypothetical protein